MFLRWNCFLESEQSLYLVREFSRLHSIWSLSSVMMSEYIWRVLNFCYVLCFGCATSEPWWKRFWWAGSCCFKKLYRHKGMSKIFYFCEYISQKFKYCSTTGKRDNRLFNILIKSFDVLLATQLPPRSYLLPSSLSLAFSMILVLVEAFSVLESSSSWFTRLFGKMFPSGKVWFTGLNAVKGLLSLP